jgi:hypothetical protein
MTMPSNPNGGLSAPAAQIDSGLRSGAARHPIFNIEILLHLMLAETSGSGSGRRGRRQLAAPPPALPKTSSP